MKAPDPKLFQVIVEHIKAAIVASRAADNAAREWSARTGRPRRECVVFAGSPIVRAACFLRVPGMRVALGEKDGKVWIEVFATGAENIDDVLAPLHEGESLASHTTAIRTAIAAAREGEDVLVLLVTGQTVALRLSAPERPITAALSATDGAA